MEWYSWVVLIGSIITAAIIIWRAMVFFVHLADDIKETKEYVFTNIKNVENIPIIEEHCRENYLTSLRLTIMSKDMPIGERIAAGSKYLALGGNGDIKTFLINELHINDRQKD